MGYEEREYEVREYQEDAIGNIWKIMEECPEFKTLLAIPIAGGKTYIALRAGKEFFSNHYDSIIVLADRNVLVDQFKEEIEAEVDSFDGEWGTISRLKKKRTDVDVDKRVCFSTYQYFFRHLQELSSLFKGKKILLIVDEAHHMLCGSYTSIIKFLEQEAGSFSLLGLTATPIRNNEEESEKFKMNLRPLYV